MMDKTEFYMRCAEIVGVDSGYVEKPPIRKKYDRVTGEPYQPLTRATRWGGREPGNGRFPGLGLIRVFGSQHIHISFKNPVFSGTFKSYEAALHALEEVFVKENKPLEVGDSIHVVLAGEDFGMCEIVKYDEEFDCWKILVEVKYLNGSVEIQERFYPKGETRA